MLHRRCATLGSAMSRQVSAAMNAASSSACTSPVKVRFSRHEAERNPGNATPTAPITQAGPAVRAWSTSSRHAASLAAKSHEGCIRIDAANRHRVEQLRQRHEELTDVVELPVTGPSQEQLSEIVAGITQAMEEAGADAIRRVFDTLVHEVRVAGRHQIQPWFKIPTNQADMEKPDSNVRMLSGLAPPIGLEPITCRLTAGCSAN